MEIQLKVREDLTGKKTPPNGEFFFIIGAVKQIEEEEGSMTEDEELI